MAWYVKLALPDRVGGRLATEADRRGVKVPDVIAEAIIKHLAAQGQPDLVRRPTAAPSPGPVSHEPLDLADEALVARIHEMRALEWSTADVARALEVHISEVRVAYKALGLKHPRRKQVAIDRDKVAELYGDGLSDARIAAILGCSVEGVRGVRNARGLPPIGRPGRRGEAAA